mmetsp:Transcript_31185/g.77759  ORF Transcript_31185/g.77759 Transcript_31185/m.77759 type:complete len:195 (-) Transcript_31185:5736-6320(-)
MAQVREIQASVLRGPPHVDSAYVLRAVGFRGLVRHLKLVPDDFYAHSMTLARLWKNSWRFLFHGSSFASKKRTARLSCKCTRASSQCTGALEIGFCEAYLSSRPIYRARSMSDQESSATPPLCIRAATRSNASLMASGLSAGILKPRQPGVRCAASVSSLEFFSHVGHIGCSGFQRPMREASMMTRLKPAIFLT